MHGPAQLDECAGPICIEMKRRVFGYAENTLFLRYAEKELPQPQPPVEFGFLNVNPEPCMDVT